MRKSWPAGALLALLLPLGACADPTSTPEETAPVPTVKVVAAAPSPSATVTVTPGPSASSPVDPPEVLYLGDSLAMENQTVLGESLKSRLDAGYTGAPFSGTTLCDYLEDSGARSLVTDDKKAAALVRTVRPDVVVLQFWGNAWGYTPCMDGITVDQEPEKYYARYAADAEKLTAQIAAAARSAGIPRPRVLWVLQGPDPITVDRIPKVNAIYRARAEADGDSLADAGKTVGPAGDRYTWAQYLPCTAYEREHPADCTQQDRGRTALHRDDDYLHFCLAPTTSTPKPCPVRSPGIERYTRAITDAVAAARTRK